MARAIVAGAKKLDPTCLKLLFERLDDFPNEHEVSGPGGEPVNAPVVTLILLPRNGREVEELIEEAQVENAIAIDEQSADPESPVNGATETNGNGDGDNAQSPGLLGLWGPRGSEG